MSEQNKDSGNKKEEYYPRFNKEFMQRVGNISLDHARECRQCMDLYTQTSLLLIGHYFETNPEDNRKNIQEIQPKILSHINTCEECGRISVELYKKMGMNLRDFHPSSTDDELRQLVRSIHIKK